MDIPGTQMVAGKGKGGRHRSPTRRGRQQSASANAAAARRTQQKYSRETNEQRQDNAALAPTTDHKSTDRHGSGRPQVPREQPDVVPPPPPSTNALEDRHNNRSPDIVDYYHFPHRHSSTNFGESNGSAGRQEAADGRGSTPLESSRRYSYDVSEKYRRHYDSIHHRPRRAKAELGSLIMSAFSSMNDLMFVQCAACGDEETMYYKGRYNDETVTYDSLFEDSTIQTESIHQIDDGEWRLQYEKLMQQHQHQRQRQQQTGTAADYPDFQTLESTLPSIAMEHGGAMQLSGYPSPMNSAPTHNQSLPTQRSNTVNDQPRHKVSEYPRAVTEVYDVGAAGRTSTLSPVRSRSQSSGPKRSTSVTRKSRSKSNSRSRSVPPIRKTTTSESSKIDEARKSKNDKVHLTKNYSSRSKSKSKNRKAAKQENDARLARKKAHQSARREASRIPSRVRSQDAPRRKSKSRPPTDKRSNDETKTEEKRGSRGMFSRFSGRSPAIQKEGKKTQVTPEATILTEQHVRQNKRTKSPGKKDESTKRPKDLPLTVFSYEERTETEEKRNDDDGHVRNTVTSQEFRDPPADPAAMVLKEQIRAELRNQFSSVPSELMSTQTALTAECPERKTKDSHVKPKRGTPTKGMKNGADAKKTSTRGKKNKTKKRKGLFRWRPSKTFSHKVVENTLPSTSDEEDDHDDEATNQFGGGEISLDPSGSRAPPYSHGPSVFLTELQTEDMSTRRSASKPRKVSSREDPSKAQHPVAFPARNLDGQGLALDDQDHHYEDPSNIHSMLTMPSFASKEHVDAVNKAGYEALFHVSSMWSDAPSDVAWEFPQKSQSIREATHE
jgi:hypothetical protein